MIITTRPTLRAAVFRLVCFGMSIKIHLSGFHVTGIGLSCCSLIRPPKVLTACFALLGDS